MPTAARALVAAGVEVADEERTEPRARPADAPAALDDEELEEPTAGELSEPAAKELEALPADALGTDDPVRVCLSEIARVALLTAEEEVVLAKAIELGEQLVEAPWRGIVSPNAAGWAVTGWRELEPDEIAVRETVTKA